MRACAQLARVSRSRQLVVLSASWGFSEFVVAAAAAAFEEMMLLLLLVVPVWWEAGLRRGTP